MKKLIMILLIITLTFLFGCSKSAVVNEVNSNHTIVNTEENSTKEDEEFAKLILDQNDTFIALSNNDASGYNRWVPFYFFLQTDLDYNVEEVEAYLKENIAELTLYDEKNVAILTTNELIWSPYKLEENKYNLTLVIQADLNITTFNETTKLNKVVLDIKGEKVDYLLDNYLIEARETISEDSLYSSQSTIETSILEEELSSSINYGIAGKEIESIRSLELHYPNGFANISSYAFETSEIDGTGNLVYHAKIYFSQPSNKVVFRPFIQVNYSNGDLGGWLIPALPAYIK